MDITPSGSFDTLSAANALQNAGFSREQAEVLSHTMARAQGDLATKADIAALQAENKADIAALRAENKADIAVVNADLDALRREVSSLRIIVLSVVLPVALANLGLTVAMFFYLLSA